MNGRNLIPLLLAASVALGGLARAAPSISFLLDEEVSRGDEAYARGLLAALEDSNDEVVAWALMLLLDKPVDVIPEVREPLLAFLRGPRVTRALREREGRLWEAAVITLGTLGETSPDVAPSLVGLLRAPDPRIREAAVKSLGKMGEAARGQAPRLVEMLKDPEWQVRQTAASVLGKMGAAAREQVPQLGELLKDPDKDARLSAARVLGSLGEAAQEQVPGLGKLLKDPDSNIRSAAADALGKMGAAARGQVPDLRKLLKDPEASVRISAERALEKLNEDPSKQVPSLNELQKARERNARRSKEAAVGRGGPTQEQAPSEQGLNVQAPGEGESAPGEMDELVKDMEEIDEMVKDMEQQAHAITEESLLDDWADSMKDVGRPAGEVAAEKALRLKDPDKAVRENVLFELMLMGEAARKQVPRIAELLKDPEKNVRAAAAMALAQLDAREQAPRIADLLKDPDRYVRDQAAEALGKLGAREQASRIIGLMLDERLGYDLLDELSTEWRALVAMAPLEVQDVVVLLGVKSKDPATRPMWLARAHGLGGGEPQVERVLRWLGRRMSSQLPTEKDFTLGEARATLRDFARLWPYSERYPSLRDELAQQISQVAILGRGQWTSADRALLQLHEKNLRSSQPMRAASIRAAIDSISQKPFLRTIGWIWVAHAGFWFLLIFFYPRSVQVQAFFFWNPWVRRILGFGYVGVLLTWVPFLRRRLLGPFHGLLLADAGLAHFSPKTYFHGSEVLVASTGKREPLLEALPRLRGQVVLEGASGLGKSMFIRYLLSTSKDLAVYLPAKRCKEGVIEAIQEKLEGHARDIRFLQSIIYSGALYIYIDGLNEVAAETRARIVQFVEPKFNGNILLATQRMEWTPPATARLYELQPLTEEQVAEFLISREPLPEERAQLRGTAYREACENFLRLALPPGQSEELRRVMLEEVLSNPLSLTVVAQMLAAGQPPDLFRLQQQQYELMAQDYQRVYLRKFPLESFSEESFRMRLEDRGTVAEDRFGKELLRMEAFKMVVRLQWRGPDGKEEREWHFRHDKLQDFFIAQTFLGLANARIIEYLDDPRFRGVYFLLATLLEPEQALALQDDLVEHAAETHNHTVSDEFILLLRARQQAKQATARGEAP